MLLFKLGETFTLAGIGAVLAGIGSLLTAIVGARMSYKKGKEEEHAALVGDRDERDSGGSSGSPGGDGPGSEQSGTD